tara:strand:+ start:202 stop:828 length:627 start_codon:yes stop_codon:yes gene_type:complete
MNTRSLTGWLLIGGPILTFVVVGVLYTQLIGDQETAASSVKEMMAKPELARLLIGIGSLVFVSMLLGLTLFARTLRGDDKPGGGYADVATIIFAGVSALAIAATGLSGGALEASKLSETIAVNIEAVSQALFGALWFFMGVGFLLIGTAMILQKRLHVALAGFYIAFGAFVIIGSLYDLNLADTVGLVVWIGMTVAVAATGLLHLKEE